MQEIGKLYWVVVGGMLLGLGGIFQPLIAAAEEQRFVRPEQTTTYIEPASKSELRIVIDQLLGGTNDVTIGDLVIPPGVDVPDHVHQSTEIFYVISGEMEQTSEGKVEKLTAGMACLVPANTATHHKVTSKEPVHALVIWAPGGEEKRLLEHWQVKQPAGSSAGY